MEESISGALETPLGGPTKAPRGEAEKRALLKVVVLPCAGEENRPGDPADCDA